VAGTSFLFPLVRSSGHRTDFENDGFIPWSGFQFWVRSHPWFALSVWKGVSGKLMLRWRRFLAEWGPTFLLGAKRRG